MKLNILQRPLLTALLLVFICSISGSAQNLPFVKGERLKYNLYYQWGIIWKKAAEATLSAQETVYHSDKALHLRMAARTTPFFDNFLRVRDTLVSLISPQQQPLFYAKITNEGSYHGKDDLFYSYNNGKVSTRSRSFRDNVKRDDTTFFHNGTPVFDMLSVFYYIRTMDLSNIKKNQDIPLVIVSGNRPFNIKVTYNGETEIEMPDDKTYKTHKVTLTFEHLNGKKMVKEQMLFWMGNDSQRLPMQFSVKLPLGSLKAYFQGAE
jgi:hypothetical protein